MRLLSPSQSEKRETPVGRKTCDSTKCRVQTHHEAFTVEWHCNLLLLCWICFFVHIYLSLSLRYIYLVHTYIYIYISLSVSLPAFRRSMWWKALSQCFPLATIRPPEYREEIQCEQHTIQKQIIYSTNVPLQTTELLDGIFVCCHRCRVMFAPRQSARTDEFFFDSFSGFNRRGEKERKKQFEMH